MAVSSEHEPLTEAFYYILLTLHTPMHGYGIMKFIKKISNGRLVLVSGALYGAIKTLQEKGWIQALDTEADSRKKEYELTLIGKKVVQNEINRLQELLKNGNHITRDESIDDNKMETLPQV